MSDSLAYESVDRHSRAASGGRTRTSTSASRRSYCSRTPPKAPSPPATCRPRVAGARTRLGRAGGHRAALLDRPPPASRAGSARAHARRGDRGRGGRGGRDRARRADQVAERRHAQPAQGVRRARRAARRGRHARHRPQRQPDARAAPRRTRHSALTGHGANDHGATTFDRARTNARRVLGYALFRLERSTTSGASGGLEDGVRSRSGHATSSAAGPSPWTARAASRQASTATVASSWTSATASASWSRPAKSLYEPLDDRGDTVACASSGSWPKRGYRRYAAYPAATWAGILTNTVFGFIQAYVLLALFETRDDIGGYDATTR